MGIFRRLILLFYVLTVLVASLIAAGVCLNIIPSPIWHNELAFIINRQESLAVIAAIIIASFILLSGIFNRNSNSSLSLSNDVLLEIGKPGEVKVTVPAIVGVVERAAITVSGVRDAKASVLRNDSSTPIKINLVITLAQGFSAPKVSQQSVAAINLALATALELNNVPVSVKVNEITHAIIERDKRVV